MTGTQSGFDRYSSLRGSFERELLENILPFWMTHAIDRERGGFHGALTNDLQVHDEYPRSAILYGRIIWTFAAAHRSFPNEAYLATAQHALDYLDRFMWDSEHGGVYWAVDSKGRPTEDRKHSYAQAFAIYGLSEHYRATGDTRSLERAEQLFHLVETHAYDPVNHGYLEGCSRTWGPLDDTRLSDREPNCHKSMNTLLHVMEAYTNLLRVWNDPELRTKLRELIEVLFAHVLDTRRHCFRLYFENDWRPLPDHVSPGHDIEGSWLLVKAAETLGASDLITRTRENAVLMAQEVYENGRDSEGMIVYEIGAGSRAGERHWWPQAEAVVGFYNAHQLSRRDHFADAAFRCWSYIQNHFVDRTNGEWFKVIRNDGTPHPGQIKIGPWECPYHHGRMCFEMIHRLS
jgi:mannobiose 2-epimerase